MTRRAVLACAMAAASARLAYAGLLRCPPAGAKTWSRTNHRGEPVTLLEGPAATAGAVAGALIAPGLSARHRVALAVAGAGAAAFGCYDDLAGTGARRGFRGHLGALARGEVTSGAVKLGGIGATGLATAVTLGGPAVDQLINSGLVAGGANLVNLFDLRPGRAIKVTLTAGALITAGSQAGRRCAAAPLGAAIALLPEDLAERAMLGDAGANALGAMLGSAAATLPRSARVATLAVIVGLTAASEVVSFTKVIERTPPLRWLDMLGRRPVAGPAAGSPARAASGPAPGSPVPAASGPAAASAAGSAADGVTGASAAQAGHGSPEPESAPASAAGRPPAAPR